MLFLDGFGGGHSELETPMSTIRNTSPPAKMHLASALQFSLRSRISHNVSSLDEEIKYFSKRKLLYLLTNFMIHNLETHESLKLKLCRMLSLLVYFSQINKLKVSTPLQYDIAIQPIRVKIG